MHDLEQFLKISAQKILGERLKILEEYFLRFVNLEKRAI